MQSTMISNDFQDWYGFIIIELECTINMNLLDVNDYESYETDLS